MSWLLSKPLTTWIVNYLLVLRQDLFYRNYQFLLTAECTRILIEWSCGTLVTTYLVGSNTYR